jgi:hypothetical protein
MRWMGLLGLMACGAEVATFPEEPRAEDAVECARSAMPAASAGVDEVAVAQGAETVAPARGAWPPIRPPQDGPPMRQREAWPFEVDTRRGPPPEALEGDALRGGMVAPEKLR